MSAPQVTASPAHRFGQPSVCGVPTEAIADLYWAYGLAEAQDYDLTRHELLVALWFEATHGQPRFRRRWRAWGEIASGLLWHAGTVDPMTVPLPPTKGGVEKEL